MAEPAVSLNDIATPRKARRNLTRRRIYRPSRAFRFTAQYHDAAALVLYEACGWKYRRQIYTYGI